VALVFTVIFVPTVTVVHKYMHQWAGQEKKERKKVNYVSKMFGEKKVGKDS
jgi:hypothetical protein